jgi:hypothetical protein
MTQSDGQLRLDPMPFAGCGGVVDAVASEREPYEALDHLMCVVEAFCPVWPHRRIFQSQGAFLL